MARLPERPVSMRFSLFEIDKIPDKRTRLLLIPAEDMPILAEEEQQVSVVHTEFNKRGYHGIGSALARRDANYRERSRDR
jgi:hypothetical protein